jgi:archaellin
LLKKWSRKDKAADVGIGSMVVFVSMILTASGAASIVISSTSEVQQQAQSTTDQAISEVTIGFSVPSILGQVDRTDYQVQQLEIFLKAQPGSPNINMENMMVVVLYRDTKMELSFSDSIANDLSYKCQLVVGTSSTSDNWTQMHVLGSGDMVKVVITDGDHDLSLEPMTPVTLDFMPSYGHGLEVRFTTPEIYESGWITLL